MQGTMGSVPGLGRPPGGGQGNPIQNSCLKNPMDRGAWKATVHRVAKSCAWLKLLSVPAPGTSFPSPNPVSLKVNSELTTRYCCCEIWWPCIFSVSCLVKFSGGSGKQTHKWYKKSSFFFGNQEKQMQRQLHLFRIPVDSWLLFFSPIGCIFGVKSKGRQSESVCCSPPKLTER